MTGIRSQDKSFIFPLQIASFFSLLSSFFVYRLCSVCWPHSIQNLTFKGTWWNLNPLRELVHYSFFVFYFILFYGLRFYTSNHVFAVWTHWRELHELHITKHGIPWKKNFNYHFLSGGLKFRVGKPCPPRRNLNTINVSTELAGVLYSMFMDTPYGVSCSAQTIQSYCAQIIHPCSA